MVTQKVCIAMTTLVNHFICTNYMYHDVHVYAHTLVHTQM